MLKVSLGGIFWLQLEIFCKSLPPFNFVPNDDKRGRKKWVSPIKHLEKKTLMHTYNCYSLMLLLTTLLKIPSTGTNLQSIKWYKNKNNIILSTTPSHALPTWSLLKQHVCTHYYFFYLYWISCFRQFSWSSRIIYLQTKAKIVQKYTVINKNISNYTIASPANMIIVDMFADTILWLFFFLQTIFRSSRIIY